MELLRVQHYHVSRRVCVIKAREGNDGKNISLSIVHDTRTLVHMRRILHRSTARISLDTA